MDFTNVNLNLQSFVDAARLCLDEGHVLPALALMYSTIDQLAFLDLPDGKQDVKREDFVRWVDTYLLPDSGLSCSALDLYAARCGLLHAQSPNSRLFREGKVKKICYAWGGTATEQMQELSDNLNYPAVAVHVNELLRALVVAENRFGTYLNRTPAKAATVARRGRGLFAAIPSEVIAKRAEIQVDEARGTDVTASAPNPGAAPDGRGRR